ncbi:AAA domain-containing protein, partial [Collybia nuda]
KSYQVITPYEGQRSIIEEAMRSTSGLDWENKCFNVDSFQGNEEDYIIISLVRSRELGFLNNLRRTNVMLTRCKKGMFIVSSHRFLDGVGSTTLVGTLMEKMGSNAWLEMEDIEKGKIFGEEEDRNRSEIWVSQAL